MEFLMADPNAFYIASAIAILFAFIVGYGIRYFTRNLRQTRLRDEQLKKTGADQLAVTRGTTPAPAKETVRLKTLEEALRGTKSSLWGRVSNALSSSPNVTAAELSTLEEVLFTSDLGPQTAQLLLEKVGDRLKRNDKNDVEKLRSALKEEMLNVFATNGHGDDDETNSTPVDIDLFAKARDLKAERGTVVWMVAGVNGAGKTTTIGKLASIAQKQGLKTMIVAGDTFRAAADAQLKEWAQRSGSVYFSAENTKDPSAVAFQALERAKTEKIDLVLVDTAGRLHTQENLMDELKKMKRVMTKIFPQAPDEVLLVLDANNGQNALEQARQFHKALDLTAVVLTKLDGTSKGGVAVGLVSELHIPIRFIGVGESVEDLRVFSPREFVDSIV